MRIYIPLTPADLHAAIGPRIVHAVTPRLRKIVPGEDTEGWEMIATLAAADDSLRMLGKQFAAADNSGLVTARRLLCVADVAEESLEDDDQLPTSLRLTGTVEWRDVDSILVDEPGHEGLVRQAISGDESAFMDSGDIDLLWYDQVERAALAAELN